MGNKQKKKPNNIPAANAPVPPAKEIVAPQPEGMVQPQRQGVRQLWQSRYPVLLFVGGFALLMGLFYFIWLSVWFTTHIQPHIIAVYATIANVALNAFGQHTHVNGDMISSSVFSINIKRGCDAVEAMALFSCALLAFPSKWKPKIKGLSAGIAFLFLLNNVRVVSLFLTGVYYPSVFEVMHVGVWEVIFVVLALALWMLWLRYVALPQKPLRMHGINPVLKFLLLFVLVYGALITAYQVIGEQTGNFVVNSGNKRFSSPFPNSMVVYGKIDEEAYDVEVKIANVTQAVNGALPAFGEKFNSYSFAYVPCVLLIALIVISPVSWKRKLVSGAIALPLFYLLLLLKMYMQIVHLCTLHFSMKLIVVTPFMNKFIDWMYTYFVMNGSMLDFIVVFMWLAVTFRKEDLAAIRKGKS